MNWFIIQTKILCYSYNMKPVNEFKEEVVVNLRSSQYHGSLPYFYSDTDFPELAPIKENWKKIFEEIQAYELKYGNITGITTYSPPKLVGHNPWNNIYLENFMWQFHNHRKKFPVTCSLLNQIPGCTLAVISILSPHSTIAPHYGDTNAVIRCHLGLQVPAPYPDCGIRVGNEEQGWKNGELTIFSEAHYHTVWNRTDTKRYVLVFDIIHPALESQKKWICSKVLGAQSFIFFDERISLLKKIPNPVLQIIHLMFSSLWWFYLLFQRIPGFFYAPKK